MKKSKDNILKSSFFLKLFGIPYGAWFLLSLIAMIPDETETDPLTWGDFLLMNIVLLLVWFIISFVITIIVNEIKKRPKVVNQIQYMNTLDEKIIVKNSKEEKIPETKKTEKKKISKCLYTCESVIDAYEWKKMVKYFPKMYWSYVLYGSFINLIISAIIAISSKSLIGTLIFFVIVEIYYLIIYKVRLEHFAEKTFLARQKKGMVDSNIYTEFYDDHFTREGEHLTLKINYSDIERCIETDTNFYLYYKARNCIVFIQKNRCDLDTINFIREKFSDLENHLGDNSKFKGIKKYHHPNFIKNAMIILFIITLLSLYGAMYSVTLVDKINPQHGFNFTKNTWVFWCWLPIPILSIILGFKYKNAGFKCTKNIVGGFIIGFLLLVYGAFCLFPTFSQDYSKINDYKNIIDATLPENGQLEIQDWGTYFDDDKTEYSIINAYYDKEDVSNLVKSIENSDNWTLSKNIKSELKIFIPSQLRSDNDAYFSIYNKTLNNYNSIPDVSGEYEIYAMKYDKSDKQLEIHKFKIKYN